MPTDPPQSREWITPANPSFAMRRVFRGPRGSIAVETRRYARPGMFTIVADDGDGMQYCAEVTLARLQDAGWQLMAVAGDV